MARLIWRKKNLSIYRLADLAKQWLSKIRDELVPRNDYLVVIQRKSKLLKKLQMNKPKRN